jgi:N-sulfoglucosamine sulfohydrolase
MADAASGRCGEAGGCTGVKTPLIDRPAGRGLSFDHAYPPTSQCAPSRAALLAGRNPWQREAAANHQPDPTRAIREGDLFCVRNFALGAGPAAIPTAI